VGKYATIQLSDGTGGFNVQNFVGTTVAGGLASAASGGSFKDGMETAAQGYLFNELQSQTTKVMQGYAGKGYPDGTVCGNECRKLNTGQVASDCPECNLIGAGATAKLGWDLIKGVAAGTPSLVDALLTAPAAGSALFKTDGAHSVSAWFRAEALDSGVYATKIGSDKLPVIQVTLNVNGGRAEYIYDKVKHVDGFVLTHSLFKIPK
jgi:hypothetical protein